MFRFPSKPWTDAEGQPYASFAPEPPAAAPVAPVVPAVRATPIPGDPEMKELVRALLNQLQAPLAAPPPPAGTELLAIVLQGQQQMLTALLQAVMGGRRDEPSGIEWLRAARELGAAPQTDPLTVIEKLKGIGILGASAASGQPSVAGEMSGLITSIMQADAITRQRSLD